MTLSLKSLKIPNKNITSRCVIYALCEPGTENIRYVGQAANLKPRYSGHYTAAKLKTNTHHNNWIKSLKRKKKRADILILWQANDPSELDRLEIGWIANCRALGYSLTNYLNGGNVSMRGKKMSAATRKKMSDAAKGIYKRAFTKEEISDILFLYETTTREVIKDKYHVANHTIKRILRDNNIVPHRLRKDKKYGTKKLNEQLVLAIRAEYIPGKRGFGYQSLATKYGVSDVNIRYIIKRWIWNWV
jgi:hypothetical protein